MLETLIVTAGIVASGMAMGYDWYKSTQALNIEYGPKLIENLENIRTAIQNKDYQRAEESFKERHAIIREADAKFEGYWMFANSEIKEVRKKGEKLEESLEVIKILNK